MRSLGEIRAIRVENNIVRLDVIVHGELVRDVIAMGPANTFAQLKAGDRVFVERTDGADAEMLASPIVFLMAASPHVIVAESIEARSAGGTAVQLATKEDIDELRGWVAAQFAAATGHVHTVAGGATTTITPSTEASPSPPTADGTAVFKAE